MNEVIIYNIQFKIEEVNKRWETNLLIQAKSIPDMDFVHGLPNNKG